MEFSKEKIRWIIIISAILVILGLTIAAVVVSQKQAVQVNETVSELLLEDNSETLSAEPIAITTISESGIMVLEKPMYLGSGSGSSDSAFAKTLTATVYPVDAPDKSVDWTAAWAPDASRASQQVSQYITVTPTSDGSNTAVVRCLKSFEGDYIYVTVTTRVGGFSATCQVEYVGVPQTLAIDTTGKSVVTDSAWGKSMLEVECGSTASLDLKLDNELHAVGSSYGNYTFSVVAHGSIDIDIHAHNNSSGEDTYSVSQIELRVGENMTSDGKYQLYLENLLIAQVSVADGKLIVEADTAMSSFAFMGGNRGGWAQRTFKQYTDGKNPYFTITVTENTTGLSKSIDVKTKATVTSVNMSAATMSF